MGCRGITDDVHRGGEITYFHCKQRFSERKMLMDLERYVACIMDKLIPGDVCPEKLFQQAGEVPG